MSSNLILRKCPRFIALKKRINTGEMGTLFNIEGDYNYGRLQKITEGWRGKLDFYSVVHGGGVHIIDLFHWLTEERISEVVAVGNGIASKGTQFRFNDMVSCLLKFESGMIGKLSVNYACVQPHFHNLAVYGTQATFFNREDHGLYYQSRNPEDQPLLMHEAYPGVHKGDLIQDFIQAIINDEESEVTKEDVFKTMSVCFAIEKSVNGKAVNVKYI